MHTLLSPTRAALLGLGLVAAQSAFATDLLNLNFDSLTAGARPTFTSGGSASGAINFINTATGTYDGSVGTQPLDAGDVGVIADVAGTLSGFGSGNAIRLYDNNAGVFSSILFGLNTSTQFASVSFNLRATGANTNGANGFLRFVFGGTDVGLNAGNSNISATGKFGRVQFENTTGGGLQFALSNPNSATTMLNGSYLTGYTAGTNDLVRIDLDRATNSYSVFFNGVSVASATMEASTSNITQIGFVTNGSGVLGDWFIDNLQVGSAIPEPSAYAALAGIGMLAAAALRRRRRA
jgi:hypothetical protein